MTYTPPNGNAVDLVFDGVYTPPAGDHVDLDLNKVSSTSIEINHTLGGATVDILLGDFPVLSAACTLGGVAADVVLEWSAGVFRGIETSRGTGYDDKRSFVDKPAAAPYKTATVTDHQTAAAHGIGQPVGGHVGGTWATSPHKHQHRRADWVEPSRAGRRSIGSAYSMPPAKQATASHRWETANQHATIYKGVHRNPGRMFRSHLAPFGAASIASTGVALPFGVGGPTFLQRESIVWGEGNPHSWIFGWITPPTPPVPLYVPSPDLEFYQKHEDYIGGAILVFGKPCYAWPLSYTSTNLVNGVFIVLHTVSVTRVRDNANIPTESVGIQFDIDSWAWSLSLNLRTAAAMALLEPVNGEPCEIRINLDGNYIQGIIENYGENRVFGQTTYTASGRSTLALLASPFAPVRSYTETAQRTAAQLIDHELSGTGWTPAYHTSIAQLFTTDWLVDAGAWSYQNTSPIEAIVRVARAAGARAYADKAATTVHIDPRYPVSPWDWATATVDKTIPISLARSINTRLAPQPAYNHVYVSGTTQGVLVSVTRNGTAGDAPAPMVTDPLITYANAGRERARNVLSNVGRQSRVTMDLPLNAVTGLLEPGALVAVSDSTPWRGLIVGTSINASHGAISQQVEIERHYS